MQRCLERGRGARASARDRKRAVAGWRCSVPAREERDGAERELRAEERDVRGGGGELEGGGGAWGQGGAELEQRGFETREREVVEVEVHVWGDGEGKWGGWTFVVSGFGFGGVVCAF